MSQNRKFARRLERRYKKHIPDVTVSLSCLKPRYPLNFSMRIQDSLKKLSMLSFLSTIPAEFERNESVFY